MTLNKLRRSFRIIFLQLILATGVVVMLSEVGETQERRTKVRISNAGFTITALPLLAAKDWGVFL